MRRPPLPLLLALFCFAIPPRLRSQEEAKAPTPPAQSRVAGIPKLDYPDSSSGLERLAKDIIKAQKENDGARADALLRSLLLPNPRAWYEMTFGPVIAKFEGALYESAAASIPATLAGDFLNTEKLNFSHLRAYRFDKSCDDDAGEYSFGILHARLQPVPLYEIRFLTGNQFLRMYAFAYVDGAFRFILPPKLEADVFPAILKTLRTKLSGKVQAAKVINRVQPNYPDKARHERLQGTVTLHALIAEDGSIKNLYVLKGYCSLAEASLAAVKQWRYTPTLLDGQPVEVDTTIQVIFSMGH
jgi:TonB family protein